MKCLLPVAVLCMLFVMVASATAPLSRLGHLRNHQPDHDQNATGFTLEYYPEKNCKGTGTKIPLPYHSCLDSKSPNTTAVIFSPVFKPTFTVKTYTKNNCTEGGIMTRFECGQCQFDKEQPEEVGHWFYQCDALKGSALSRKQCDSECNHCNKTAEVTRQVGQCYTYGQNHNEIELVSINVATPFVGERLWNQQSFDPKNPKCNQGYIGSVDVPCNQCLSTFQFLC